MIFAAGDWIRPKHLRLDDGDPAICEDVPVRTDGGAAGLTLRQREALELARRHGSVRRGDLVARFRISGEAARRDLAALTRAGLVRRVSVAGISRYVLAEERQPPTGAAQS